MGIINSIEEDEEERTEDLEAGLRPEDLTYLQIPFSSLANLAPQLHSTACVKSPVNLQKSSLQLLTTEEPNKYNLQFVVDTTTGCVIKIFYKASEVYDNDLQMLVYKSSYDVTNIHSITLPKGLNQTVVTPKELQLDLTLFKEEELVQSEQTPNYYPVVIVLEPIKSRITNVSSNEKKQISAQITMAMLSKSTEKSSYEIKPIKQKIMFGGISYVVYEIYGVENIKYGIDAHPEECVICMSEPRNTIILPCRHLCLCDQCADALRFQTNKCPICRGPVRSLLKIEVHEAENSTKGESVSNQRLVSSSSLSEENITPQDEKINSHKKKTHSSDHKKRNRSKKTTHKQKTSQEETIPLTSNSSTDNDDVSSKTTKQESDAVVFRSEDTRSSSPLNKNEVSPKLEPLSNSTKEITLSVLSESSTSSTSQPLSETEEKKEIQMKEVSFKASNEIPIPSTEQTQRPSNSSSNFQKKTSTSQEQKKESKTPVTAT